MGRNTQAFLQGAPVPQVRRISHIGHKAPVCVARPPSGSPHPTRDRDGKREDGVRHFLPRLIRPARLPSAVVATAGALLGAALTTGALFNAPAPRGGSGSGRPVHAAQAATTTTTEVRVAKRETAGTATPSSSSKKQLRYDGRQELDSREKAMSLTMTAGTFAALGVWAWKQNRRDDELETLRIKEEVDRLEKMRAEFMDVEDDDESMDNEDLLASLKQRISEGEEDDSDKEDADADGEGDAQTADGAKDVTAVAGDDEKVGTDGEQGDVEGSSQPGSVDMLRRMWEATDEDSKKNKS